MERAKREKGLQNILPAALLYHPYIGVEDIALSPSDYALYILKYNFMNTLVFSPFLSFLYGIFLHCMPHRVTTNWVVYKCD